MRLTRALAFLTAACALGWAPAHAACAAPALRPIHALAQAVPGPATVAGVVTAVFPGLHGYFIEAPQADWDRDRATSEGLFVYIGHRRSQVAAGEAIVLAGRFQRFHGMPELGDVHVIERCGKRALPPAVVLGWPPGRAGGWQGVLGMRVRFGQPLYVTGLNDAGRYGEIRLAAGGRLFAPTALTAPGPGAAALASAEAARELWMDDGSTSAPRQGLRLGGHRFGPARPLREGQKIMALEGIAFHAFNRNMLEPTGFKLGGETNPRRMPSALGLPAGPRVVSFNVENYFNHALHGPPFPTERGARNKAGFACQTRKLVAALVALKPALAGLQEIENDGYGPGSALAQLVAALNRAVPGAPYRAIHPPLRRLGGDLIAPALIYDSRLLAPLGKVAVLSAAGEDPASIGLARPALAASFRLRASGLAFTAAVVHLRSKRSSCGPDLDSHAGAGHCARARAAAVAPLSHWLESQPTGAATNNLLILGDFNAYPKERAIVRLRKLDWVSLIGRYVPRGSRYTEGYRGHVGELDYIFANPAFAGHVAGAAVWHSDADEARAHAYDGKFATCAAKATPWRASDHDPVIAVTRRKQ